MARRVITPSSAPKPKPAGSNSRRSAVRLQDFARWNHSAMAWEDGSILVVGGQAGYKLASDYLLYEPGTGEWVSQKAPFRPRTHPGLVAIGPGRALLIGGGNRAETFDYDDEGKGAAGLDDAWIFENGGWRQIVSCAERHLSPLLIPAGEDVLVIDQYSEQWIRREEDFHQAPRIGGRWVDAVSTHRETPVGYADGRLFSWNA